MTTSLFPLDTIVKFYGETYGKVIGYMNYVGHEYRILTADGFELHVEIGDCVLVYPA